MDSVREENRSETHLFRSDRSLTCLPEFVNYTWVASKVLFASNKDDRQTSTEMHNFGNPLRENWFRICMSRNGEAGKTKKEKSILSPGHYQASPESRLRNK